MKGFVLVAFVTVTALSEMWLGWAGLHLPLVLGEPLPEVGLVGEYREVLVFVKPTVVSPVSRSGKSIQT